MLGRHFFHRPKVPQLPSIEANFCGRLQTVALQRPALEELFRRCRVLHENGAGSHVVVNVSTLGYRQRFTKHALGVHCENDVGTTKSRMPTFVVDSAL